MAHRRVRNAPHSHRGYRHTHTAKHDLNVLAFIKIAKGQLDAWLAVEVWQPIGQDAQNTTTISGAERT
jgi:hypothetical protein